ncbi:MAG: TA system VapC family ribonuclease toxin [Thermoanaerobaculia bacterium]|nr:TA system VapC family ribonuclease toxin [Thermoanaerobaculia bacterium]
MAALLDVNTLVALAWPNHVHHRAARSWFGRHHASGWATCPLTESGFVRVSSSPRATSEARTPAEAVLLLRRLVALPGHRFWRDDVSRARDETLELDRLVGHRQVTDAHLLLLAIRNGGRVVTFDRGLGQLVPPVHDPEELLLLLA